MNNFSLAVRYRWACDPFSGEINIIMIVYKLIICFDLLFIGPKVLTPVLL